MHNNRGRIKCIKAAGFDLLARAPREAFALIPFYTLLEIDTTLLSLIRYNA